MTLWEVVGIVASGWAVLFALACVTGRYLATLTDPDTPEPP